MTEKTSRSASPKNNNRISFSTHNNRQFSEFTRMTEKSSRSGSPKNNNRSSFSTNI